MAFSNDERIAHVIRRLGVGAHPLMLESLASVESAISAALDLSVPARQLQRLEAPTSRDDALDPGKIREPVEWMIESMVEPTRLIEERLAWFWHDHFATSLRKIPIAYVHWELYLTIRQHATTNFADLLHAVAVAPAMLGYLDGNQNSVDEPNENFAREVMELYTLGVDNYTQQDVTEAARAFTGWVVNVPFARDQRAQGVEPWESLFVDRRHDTGAKTMLGVTGNLDLPTAIDVLLDQPQTKRNISAKLFTELVGARPDEQTTDRLAAAFTDFEIMPLVEAIVAEPAFLDDANIRSRVRTPLERFVTVIQGFGFPRIGLQRLAEWFHAVGYLPFNPPNPAGYPRGTELLGPHAVIHGFDLTRLIDPRQIPDDPLAALGIIDPFSETTTAMENEPDPKRRLALALNLPEMYLT